MCCDGCTMNCYNDKTRYRTMFILYIIDFIFFIIRLALVSNDISQKVSNTIPFLIPVLLFDLIASVPIIISNILYVIMRHCINPLIGKNSSSKYFWHCATLTCIRNDCHKNRPQAILLMRILFLICSLLLKFICFVVSASCSARFQSQCTAYTVIAAFALVASILVIIIEFINYFRLWKYNPTKTGNSNNTNQISWANIDKVITRTHRRHLGFVHYSLLNDQNAENFRHSKCENGIDCKSETLHHYLFYHTLEAEHTIDFNSLTDNEKKSFIALYQTTKTEAFDIAQNGFPYGDNTNPSSKDYLHLKQTIFFTRSCSQNVRPSEAIICARLNLGRIKTVVRTDALDLNRSFGLADGDCDTIYTVDTRRIYLRMPGQIEKWIICINRNVQVNDILDGEPYQPCF